MNKEKEIYEKGWGWTSFLKKDFQDPYAVYKDGIAFQLENIIVKVENELLKSNKDYTTEIARKMAICLVMEQMLIIQNETAPSTLNTMVANLFTELPGLKDFRIDIYEKFREGMVPKKKSWFAKFFKK